MISIFSPRGPALSGLRSSALNPTRRARGPAVLDLDSVRVSAAPTGRPQAKLTLGQPGDRFEREADAVADRVMREEDPRLSVGGAATGVQRKCDSCEKEDEKVRRTALGEGEKEDEEVKASPAAGGLGGMSATTASAIQSARGGGGFSLPGPVRQRMEPRFGHDLGSVRVHADREAAGLARSVGARAFTVGSDVFFGEGQYQPAAQEGQRLLAHELTHVLQQRRG